MLVAGVAGALFGVLGDRIADHGRELRGVQAFLSGGRRRWLPWPALWQRVAPTGEMHSVLASFTNDTFARFIIFVLIVVFLGFRPQGLFAQEGVRR